MICLPDALTEIRIYDGAQLNLPESIDEEGDGGLLGGFGGEPQPGKPVSGSPPPAAASVIKRRGIDVLAEIIPGIIRPNSWMMNGGSEAELKLLGDRLVVVATPAMHREIESFLNQIGKKQVAAAQLETPSRHQEH